MSSIAVDQALGLPSRRRGTALLQLTEDQWYERKSIRIAPKDLAAALVGLANAEGGTVVVGLSAGAVEDLSSQAHKVNSLRQVPLDHTTPPVRARYEEVQVSTPEGGSTVLVVRIDPGESVHELTNGDCYLRVGDETRKLSYVQRQELHYDRGSAPYDGQPVGGVAIEDLDPTQIEAFRAALGSDREIPRVLQARSLLTASGQVTVGAYLLFASEPQRLMPHAHVRILIYRSPERGTGSRQSLDAEGDIRVEGSIPTVIHAAAERLDGWVPRRRALGAEGRFVDVPVIPRAAWLEGLVNAVVHRSYSAAGDHVRVEVFPDRVEIESPGRFPGIVDPARPLDIARYARNPRIARVCSDLSITQELGEGIRRMFEEMRDSGLGDPVYRQTSGSVRLTLVAVRRLDPALARRLPTGAEEMLRVLRTASRPLGTGEVMDLVGRSRPWVTRVLGRLRDAGEVTWTGKSARDPRATWTVER